MQRCVNGTRDVIYCHCCTWWLVMQASYVRLTYVVRDPLTDLLRGWSLWVQCGGNMRKTTPLCLHYSTVCMDRCKLWLSSDRTTGVSFEGLACAMEWSAYLTKWSSRHLPRWMDRVLNVLNVPCVQWQCWWGAFYVSLSYPVAVYCQNKKMNLKILRPLPVFVPRLPTPLTPRSSASRRVLLLSDLFLQVRII